MTSLFTPMAEKRPVRITVGDKYTCKYAKLDVALIQCLYRSFYFSLMDCYTVTNACAFMNSSKNLGLTVCGHAITPLIPRDFTNANAKCPYRYGPYRSHIGCNGTDGGVTVRTF